MSKKKLKHLAIVAERTNGFSRNVIEGIADFAASHENWSLELLDPLHLSGCSFDRFDGFITRLPDTRTAERLSKLRRPVVETANVIDAPEEFVKVYDDSVAVSRLAAEHFLALHHTHFAYCGFDGQLYSRERGLAFADALKARGRDTLFYRASKSARTCFRNVSQYNSPLDIPDAEALTDWLKSLPKPVALFCCNDRRAYQVIRLCRLAGIKTPNDISICGVDNDIVICTFPSPRLSSVDPDAHRVGLTAADVLAGLLNEPGHVRRKPGTLVTTSPKGVVTRTSTAPFPIDPPWLSDALLFIRQHTCDHLTASDVCAFVGKSNGALNTVLRDKLGTTVQKEIAVARLEVAKTLLFCEDIPIQDVAIQAGFASPEYFCRCFYAAVGVSPSAFREAGARASSALRRSDVAKVRRLGP